MADQRILGVILAGGRSTRMGRDKSLITLAGQSLLARAIERLGPQVDDLAVSANGDPARLLRPGMTVLPDAIPGFAGPLAGVLAGLDWGAAAGADRVQSVAVDTPFFPADLTDRLRRAAGDASGAVAVACSFGQEHPTFALWPVGLREDMRAFLQAGATFRVRDFLALCSVVTVDFSPIRGIDPFFNVNRPDDLAEAEQLAGGFVS